MLLAPGKGGQVPRPDLKSHLQMPRCPICIILFLGDTANLEPKYPTLRLMLHIQVDCFIGIVFQRRAEIEELMLTQTV